MLGTRGYPQTSGRILRSFRGPIDLLKGRSGALFGAFLAQLRWPLGGVFLAPPTPRPMLPVEQVGPRYGTKPYKCTGFGAMDVTKSYKCIGFGAMDATKPYKFIGFGTMDATKPYKFIGFTSGSYPAGPLTAASTELAHSFYKNRIVIEAPRNRARIVRNRCVPVCGHRVGYFGLGLAQL